MVQDVNIEPVQSVEKHFDIVVKISSDYLSATCSIDKFDEEAIISKEDIMEALKRKNVSFGIDNNKISEIIESQSADKEIVASGKPFVHGQDAVLTYNFDVDELNKPAVNEDGTVDFKNMHFCKSVKKGDILATKTEPTLGESGTLVTGKIIKGRNGKIVNFKLGENVEVSEDGLSAIATSDGSIDFDMGKLSVKKVLNISSDVGPRTGNIKFSGKVNVEGSILTGYEVIATDDIVVEGIIEGAVVHSDHDVIVNGGIQGNEEAVISAKHDVMSRFINNATVTAGNDIKTNTLLHSKSKAEGQIDVTAGKGLIVGGMCTAKKLIKAKQIGTDMGTKTTVEVGVDSEFFKGFKKKQAELQQLKENSAKLEKVIKLLNAQYAQTNEQGTYDSITKSVETKKEYDKDITTLSAKVREMSILLEKMKNSEVLVNHIFQGVRIKISSTYFIVKEEMLDIKFRKKKADIVCEPMDS